MEFVLGNANDKNATIKISDKDVFSDDFKKLIQYVLVLSYIEYIQGDQELEKMMDNAMSNIMSIASHAARRLFVRVGEDFISDDGPKDFHEKMINLAKEILEGSNGQN